ncbi:hypothetical protein JCM9279_004434 [Rhodotorula babjevae]
MALAPVQPAAGSSQAMAGASGSRGPGDELEVGNAQRNEPNDGKARKGIIVDLTLSDSGDDHLDQDDSDGASLENLVKHSPTAAPKAPLKAVLVRRSPAQVPRAGPASLSPYPNPLPLLRPAIEEFDTPIRKRPHSPEAAAKQKRVRGPGVDGVQPHERDSGVHLPSPSLSRNGTRSEAASPEVAVKTLAEASSSAQQDASLDRVDEDGATSGKPGLQESAAVDSHDGEAASPVLVADSARATAAPDAALLDEKVEKSMAPPPVPTPSASRARPRVARTSSARRMKVEQQLLADKHVCRRPATPSSLPNLFSPTCVIDILVCTPSLPVIRPHARFDPSSRTRSSEPVGSPELGVAPASSTAPRTSPSLAVDASLGRRRRTTGFIESSEDHWAHILPDLTDCPHVGDDIALLDPVQHERRYRPGLDPSALPLRDVAVELNERAFDDSKLLGVEQSAAFVRAARLPDAWGVQAADELAQQERDARRVERGARRAGRARSAASGARGSEAENEGEGEGGSRRGGGAGRSKVERQRASRARLQPETEAELQARLQRLDLVLQLDDPGLATDSGASSSTGSSSEDDAAGGGARAAVPRPTLGYRALALRVQAEYRAKRRARQAAGRDLDESTDEEGG